MVPHGSTALVNPEYMKTAPVSRRHIHVTAAIMYRCVPDRVTVADASTTSLSPVLGVQCCCSDIG